MSQVSDLAGNGSGSRGAGSSTNGTTGRAVLLLTVLVVLGVLLLQQLEKNPSNAATKHASSEKAAAVTPTSTPTTLAVRLPAEVKVLVANASTTSGVAAKVTSRLQPVGYNLLRPGNTANRATTSSVAYQPGYQNEAQSVATSLSIPTSAVVAMPTPAPVTDLQGANVLVIVGMDLAATTSNQSTTSTVVGATGGSSQAGTGQTGSGQTGAGTTATQSGAGQSSATQNGAATGTGSSSGATAASGPLNNLSATTSTTVAR